MRSLLRFSSRRKAVCWLVFEKGLLRCFGEFAAEGESPIREWPAGTSLMEIKRDMGSGWQVSEVMDSSQSFDRLKREGKLRS